MTEKEIIREAISQIELPEMVDQSKDKDIDSESSKQNYLNLITENIRSNNKAIQRNSFLLVLSLTIYFLILSGYITKLNLVSFTLRDKNILLNGIAVLFSYLYMVNIVRWYNNNDLRPLFDRLSQDLYKIGALSGTLTIIRPFSIMFHGLDYQTERKDLKWFTKIWGTILQVLVLFGPISLEVYFIYNIFKLNTLNLISIVCCAFTILLFLNTLSFAAKSR